MDSGSKRSEQLKEEPRKGSALGTACLRGDEEDAGLDGTAGVILEVSFLDAVVVASIVTATLDVPVVLAVATASVGLGRNKFEIAEQRRESELND
jgi:hypothetical protein